jgi:hypothetical protein
VFSNVVSLISCKRSSLVVLRRQEGRSIPGGLDSIDHEDELLAHKNTGYCHNDRDSPFEAAVQKEVNSRHEDPNHPRDRDQERKDVAFSSPLTSLTSHKVLRNVHISELVSVEFEPGHTMDNAVDDSTCADYEGHHGDGKPDVGLEQDDSDVFEGGNQDQYDHQTLVHVVDYCLCIVDLVRSDEPSVFFLIEFFGFQSLLLLE